MKAFFLILLVAVGGTQAATTIDPIDKNAYSANLGWMDWRGDGTAGAVIGEYVCSGYIYAANVGWISLGTGSPVNQIRYQNLSASDFGVNQDGRGNLRGFAYGANVGWINFEDTGAAKVDLHTGQLSGAVWSENCGWIGLDNAFAQVRTTFIQPGIDSDGDGIPDAWELTYTNNLTAFSAVSDSDGDGVSDLNEQLADTNPLDAKDFLKITAYTAELGLNVETNRITWNTKPTRLYQLQDRLAFNPGVAWADVTPVLSPGQNTLITQELTNASPPAERYFRVKALKPLSP